MMEYDYKKYNEAADMLKVLAHPIRLCIVQGLLQNGECNVTHMKNCLGAPQSTISQHLQKLKAARIIEARRNGLEIYYSISTSNEKIMELVKALLK